MLTNRKKWQMLASIWMRALAEEEMMIPCEDAATARRLRADLYAAMRRAQRPRSFDQELLDAGKELSITIKENTVVIYRRILPPHIAQGIGSVDESNQVITSDESFAKLEKLLGGS